MGRRRSALVSVGLALLLFVIIRMSPEPAPSPRHARARTYPVPTKGPTVRPAPTHPPIHLRVPRVFGHDAAKKLAARLASVLVDRGDFAHIRDARKAMDHNIISMRLIKLSYKNRVM